MEQEDRPMLAGKRGLFFYCYARSCWVRDWWAMMSLLGACKELGPGWCASVRVSGTFASMGSIDRVGGREDEQ